MKKALVALAAILIFAGCKDPKAGPESRYVADLKAGSPSVDFLYKDMDGVPFRLSEKKGKAVILYFWRMKCAECREELKGLDALQRGYGPRGLIVVAVGADSMHSASIQEVSDFLNAGQFSFTRIRDEDGYVSEAYSALRAPEAFIIDRDGDIAFVQKGPVDWAGPEMTGRIEAILKGGAR